MIKNAVKELSTIFRNRLSFDKTERKLYGHDIAVVPGLVNLIIGSTIPDVVVQPESEEELVQLARWSVKHRIPLTPRGQSTSGYGGALPVKKGVVVDFHRMNKIIKVDPSDHTATVQAGVIWEKLDRELGKQGATLRLYPSSYPGSTIGGWLAHGGAGIGSFEFGMFKENVISARVILPGGTIKEFSGPDLDLVADAEGITGLISEITFRIMPLEDLKITAVGMKDVFNLQKLAQLIVDSELPVWSALFINPRMAKMKNNSPLLEHGRHAVEERIILPEEYILTLAFRAKDNEVVSGKLSELVRSCDGEILSDAIAQHEWTNRFKIMMVKRLGPSLVPAEFIVPLDKLGKSLAEIEKKVKQPIVKEGLIIKRGLDDKPKVVILGFIPSDQRKFGYNFVFALALTIMKIAGKYGGRPYATGLYFAGRSADILGKERVQRLASFKQEIDPKGLFNPGKVIGHGLAGIFMDIAGFLEPIIRPFSNSVVTEVGELKCTKPVRGIPGDVAWFSYSCSQCGYCVLECDQFYGRGWESQSPRGRWFWLREYLEGREKWSQRMVDAFLACTTCEMCNTRCSVNLPIESSWTKLRGILVQDEKRMTFPPFEMMAAALQKEGDIWAGYRKNRNDWFPHDLVERHGTSRKAGAVYFAGCTASYVEHDIAMASVRLLDAAGVDFTYLGPKENCCGTPMLVAGKWEVFFETMKKNIEAVKSSGAGTVITSCPACDMMWRHVYPEWSKKRGISFDIKVKHYSEVVAEKIKSKEFSFPGNNLESTAVTWHDSCHMGRVSGIYDAPRELIKAIPGVKLVEMEYNREQSHCCGSVLTLIKDPPVAADVGEVRLSEAVKAGAQKLIALCPCCEFQLRVSGDKKKIPMEVVDLARFAASALGHKFPDPVPEVQKQWAVFEAMISLMTPQGFAALMGTMWPELISAMPLGMGKMMSLMGKIPGALPIMKPLFPILFPIMLPMMMPGVMPTMLERVKERIPMPDYMSEQMAELMPKVMDNLMPHMIGDLVPLVTQPMIEYLQGKSQK